MNEGITMAVYSNMEICHLIETTDFPQTFVSPCAVFISYDIMVFISVF